MSFKLTKPPLVARRVVADDFEIEIDGVVYHPHAGEWVEFTGRPSLGLYLKITEMMQSREGMTLLAGLITAWTFTDDRRQPYDSPPTADTLLLLPPEELGWVISASMGNAMGEAAKNSSAPST